MVLPHTLAVVFGVSTVLLLVLSSFVVGRKAARDREELRSSDRRRRFADALRDRRPTQLVALVDEVVRDERAQVDLLVELGFLGPFLDRGSRGCLAAAARDFGLVARLEDDLAHRDPVRRGRAGLLLARLHVDEAIVHLPGLLGDRDADVRAAACAGLALTRSPAAALALVAALEPGELAAERLIERLGAPWAVPTILMLLPSRATEADTGSRTRAHLARALGLAGLRIAEPALIDLLRTGGEEERISAARALAGAGGPVAASALEGALEDPSWPVRAQAARALGALRVTAAAPGIAALLGDGAWWVRAAAAEALGMLGDAGVAELRAALHADDRFARDRAREQLALLALATPDGERAVAVAA